MPGLSPRPDHPVTALAPLAPSFARSALPRKRVRSLTLNGPRMMERRASFDHLVGAGEQRRRYLQPNCSRGLEIDHEFELCGLLNGQVSRLGALQNLVDVRRGTSVLVRQIRPVGHEATGVNELLVSMNHRKSLPRSQFNDLLSMRCENYVV